LSCTAATAVSLARRRCSAWRRGELELALQEENLLESEVPPGVVEVQMRIVTKSTPSSARPPLRAAAYSTSLGVEGLAELLVTAGVEHHHQPGLAPRDLEGQITVVRERRQQRRERLRATA
jgi:hypothetical protein